MPFIDTADIRQIFEAREATNKFQNSKQNLWKPEPTKLISNIHDVMYDNTSDNFLQIFQ